jgi:hypothetical protein
MTLEYSSLYGLRRLGREYMTIREEILWIARFPNTFCNLRGNYIVSRHDGLTKNNIRDLPLSGELQSDLIQLEHRTPGVGVENAITPWRLSACSMLSSVEATLVGGLLPLLSQYRTDRG